MKKRSKTSSRIVKYSQKELIHLKHKSKTQLAKLDALSDRDIDYSDIPELDAHAWMKAKVVDPAKKPISIRVDEDVLAWFKHQHGRYQKLINYVLRQYMNAQKQR